MKTLFAILCSLCTVAQILAADGPVRSEPPDLAQFAREVRACFDQLRLPGLSVAVVKDGRVIYKQHEGFADLERKTPIRPDSIFWLSSVTKTFSAVMMMQYARDGKLSLDDPVIQYPFTSVGFLPQRINEKTRLKHVLSHTSEGVPGDTFVYHGGRYNFIYGVFERMSGLKYPQAFPHELEQRIFRPLKLEDTLVGCPDTDQSALRARVVTPYLFDDKTREFRVNHDALTMRGAFPATGLLSSIGDLAVFTTALDENRLLPQASYDQMTAPFIDNREQPVGYGMGWFTETFAGLQLHWAYGAGESDSAILLRVPALKLSLIVLCNCSLPSACSRLGGGNPLHSPFVVSFFKHFVLDPRLSQPAIDYSAPVQRIREELAKQQTENPHRIRLEELFSQALLQTLVEKKFGEKNGRSEALTRLFYDLDRGAFANNDPAVFYLLSQQPGTNLDAAANVAIASYRSSGRFHPWILRSIAQRYEAKGDLENASRCSRELVDTPGFEEQTDKIDACAWLANQYTQRGDLDQARHYGWAALTYTLQAGYNDANALKQLNEINRRAMAKRPAQIKP